MKPYEERLKEAKTYHAQGMLRVKNDPEPEGQKYPCGSRVRIDVDLGEFTNAFIGKGKYATVEYVYAHAYGGDNVTSYSLDVDDLGSSAWYDEIDLTSIEDK